MAHGAGIAFFAVLDLEGAVAAGFGQGSGKKGQQEDKKRVEMNEGSREHGRDMECGKVAGFYRVQKSTDRPDSAF